MPMPAGSTTGRNEVTKSPLNMPIAEPQQSLAEIDFFSPDVLAEPLGYLQKARTEMPVVPIAASATQPVEFLITTYDLVHEVLTNSALFSSNYTAILKGDATDHPAVEAIRKHGFVEVDSLLTADGSDHRRMRSLVSKAFVPARVREMEEAMKIVVADLVAELSERSEIDIIEDFSSKLPANILAFLMGLEKEQQRDVQLWSAAITRRFGQMGTLEQRIEDERVILEAKQFMEWLVNDRRGSPKKDLVSDLIAAHDEDEGKLSELEILATIFILFVGATETTFSSLNFGIAHLLENPDMLQHLEENPADVSLFSEEVLRFYPPVGGFWRIAQSDVMLGGTPISRGSMIMVRVDSANRDARQFENPDEFDIFRKNNVRHLSFSGGAHACLGFRVAKMELNLAFAALLPLLKHAQIDAEKSDLTLLPSTHSKCITALHVMNSRR